MALFESRYGNEGGLYEWFAVCAYWWPWSELWGQTVQINRIRALNVPASPPPFDPPREK